MKKTINIQKRNALATAIVLTMVAAVAFIVATNWDSIKSVAYASDCKPEFVMGSVDDNGNATITNHSGDCTYKVGIASYQMFNTSIPDQKIFDSASYTLKPKET